MPCLVLLSERFGDRVYPLNEARTTIGRAPDRDICIPDRLVSSTHADIVRREGKWYVQDHEAKNGTFVNGVAVLGEQEVKANDRIEVANIQLFFSDKQFAPTGAVGLTETERLYRAFPANPAAAPPGATIKFPMAELEQEFLRRRIAREGPGLSEQKLGVLFNLANALGGLQSSDEILKKTLDLALVVIPGDRGYVFLADEETGALAPKEIRKRMGLVDESTVAISQTILEEVLKEHRAIATSDAAEDKRFRDASSVALHSIHSVLAVPMQVKERVVGVLYVDSVSPTFSFSPDDLKLLAVIAAQAAVSIENARLFEAVSRARDEITAWSRELERKVEERTREMTRQKEEIERLSGEKDELLGMVAHDLRTPLTCILGYLDMLAVKAQRGVPVAEFAPEIGTLAETGRDMVLLLNDLLDLAKIEAGKIHLACEPRDLGQLAREAAAVYSRLSSGREISVEVRGGREIPPIRCDRKRIQQVLNNLLHNAVKFSRPGDQVSVIVEREGEDKVAVTVADTGPGIASGEIDRIFGRFEQGAAALGSAEKGYGLGLAIVKKLVALHAGELRVKSKKGHGARFTFVIPIRGPGGAAASPGAPAPAPRG